MRLGVGSKRTRLLSGQAIWSTMKPLESAPSQQQKAPHFLRRFSLDWLKVRSPRP